MTNEQKIETIAQLLDSVDVSPLKAKLHNAGVPERAREKIRDAIALTLYAFEFAAREGVNNHALGNVNTALCILTGVWPDQSEGNE
jgi:hypothetical protein